MKSIKPLLLIIITMVTTVVIAPVSAKLFDNIKPLSGHTLKDQLLNAQSVLDKGNSSIQFTLTPPKSAINKDRVDIKYNNNVNNFFTSTMIFNDKLQKFISCFS